MGYSGLVSYSAFLAGVPDITATQFLGREFSGLSWPKDQGHRNYRLDLES